MRDHAHYGDSMEFQSAYAEGWQDASVEKAEQIEALRQDAERYRWINAQDNFLAYIELPDGTKRLRLKCGEYLDSFIDKEIAAAMKEAGK